MDAIELAGKTTVPATSIPLLKVCLAVHVLRLVKDAPPPDPVGKPLIHEALILLFGNVTVPNATFNPALKVCKAVHVFAVPN